MTDILERICADKRDHVAAMKLSISMTEQMVRAEAQPVPRGFRRALLAAAARPNLIAEIKKASPSHGLIRADFDVAAIARDYAAAGAACLSVLTDAPYFQGVDENVGLARAACALPVLRKDFMLDPYQIVESHALGADCVLLIMAALDNGQYAELLDAARGCGLDALVEVHDRAELDRALRRNPDLVGVNSRNLKTLAVDSKIVFDLAPILPPGAVGVAESGIRVYADIVAMQRAGYRGFLVGESLLRQDDIIQATRSLLGA